MRAFVAVTDNEWFDSLASQPGLDEINFWTPSAKPLARMEMGQPVLFKLHRENYLAGGGFFAHFSELPVSLAWEVFGAKNGARSFVEMRQRIEHYRRVAPQPHEDSRIGCVILADPFFLERPRWIPAPADFHPNIVRGKSYDLASVEGRDLWERVLGERAAGQLREPRPAREGPMFGEAVRIRQRLGQGTFRVMITDTYERRCAVTQEKALPVLQAAHIKPVGEGGLHRVENGLLLRSDVHALYDRGYVTVTPDFTFHASRRLKDDFDNGEHYLQLSGTRIWLPSDDRDRPARDLLEWHADTVFLR